MINFERLKLHANLSIYLDFLLQLLLKSSNRMFSLFSESNIILRKLISLFFDRLKFSMQNGDIIFQLKIA